MLTVHRARLRLKEHTAVVRSSVEPRGTWWLSPCGITLGFLLPVLLYVAAIGQSNNPDVMLRTMSFLDARYMYLAVLVLSVMALSGWIGARIHPARPADIARYEVRPIAIVVGWLLCLTYLFAFRDLLIHPSTLLQALHGWRPTRAETGRISGITSLTNTAPAFFVLVCYRCFFQRKRIGWHLAVLSTVIIALTVFRAYFWSERLALIEIAVPIGILWVVAPDSSPSRLKWVVRKFGIYAALPLAIAYFSAGEYFRSWQSSYYNNGSREFWGYVLGRFATYYYTSLNNGAGILATTDWPTYDMTVVLEWLHKFPFGIGRRFALWMNVDPNAGIGHFLDTYGDPEFNNPSGIFSVLADVGIPLGLVYFSSFAFLTGIAYRRLLAGWLDSAVLFPLLMMGFLELYRYAYWSSGRALPWFLMVGVVVWKAIPRAASLRRARSLPSCFLPREARP